MNKFTKRNFLRGAVVAFCAQLFSFTSFAQPTATVTVGNINSTTNNYTVPINNFYNYSYSQQIYLASEINKPLGGTITKIRFFWAGGSASMASSNDWTVAIGHTTKNAFSTSTVDWVTPTSLSQVFQGIITVGSTNGWVELTLTTPFIYNGTENIVVAAWENQTSYPGTSSVFKSTAAATTTTYRSMAYYSDAAQATPTNPQTTSNLGKYAYYPNIQFEFIVPPDNAGVDAIVEPTSAPFCSGLKTVKANVHNFGSSIINNVTVNWKVNGVLQTPINYTTPIDMENTPGSPDAVVTLGTVNFVHNTPTNIQAWTSMPNGTADTGPSNDSTSTQITASLLGINDLEITPQDTTICIGSTISLDAGSYPLNPIYIWSNGVITQTNEVATAGTYNVFVQNTDGCSARDTVNISVHPNPVANSIAINDLGNGSFQFGILGGYNIDTYNWNFGDGTQQSGGSTMTKQYATSGEYTVTVTMSNQCGEITIVRVLAVVVGNGTGVNDLKGLANDLKMYPNPGRDKVIITHNGGIKMKHVELYNLMGQKVYSEAVNAEKQEINISNLASGIYNVVIDTDKGKATKKLEVIR